MPDWNGLIVRAIMSGALLSAALTIIMLISARIAVDMWVGDYPPDIRAKYGPMSRRGARARPYVAAAFFVTVLAIPMLGLAAVQKEMGHVSFAAALTFGGVAVLVFNLFDLLILDWLLFCTIQPRSMILPGTDGMAGYRDYGFHFIGFLKGLGFCIVGGLTIAVGWLGVQALLT